MDFDLRAHTVLLTRAGSRAYGMHTATSDLDVKGLAVPPKSYVLGLKTFEQADKPSHLEGYLDLLGPEELAVVRATKLEGSVYDYRKFMRLAAGCNPSMLDALFCRDQDILLCTPAGHLLRENRDLFLSRAARGAYLGYAAQQLSRIKLHRRWYQNPVETEPTRAAFGLPERSLIPDYKLGPVNAAIKKKLDSWQFDLNDVSPQVRDDVHYQVGRFLTEIMETTDSRWKCAARSLGLEDDFIQLLTEERRYQVAREDWKSYQDWKRNRNPERAAMEEKFGFDGKHGSHVVRLYRQGFELMLTGKVTVWRGGLDAEELLSIRKGAWSYEDLMAFTESMETKLHEVYTSGTCPLPYRPDYDALSDLAVRVWSVAQ